MTKTLDDNFRDWEGSTFGFGYGSGEPHVVPALKTFMDLLNDQRNYDYRVLEERFGPLAAWLLINALCHADMIEYGVSPRFGWLTRKGEALRAYIETRSADELLEVLNYDQDYIHCYPTHCNCDDGKCSNPFWASAGGSR